MNAPAAQSATPETKPKGPAPVLRAIERDGTGWKESVVLWATREDANAKLKGFVMIGDRKVQVLGFVNTKEEDGSKFIALSEKTEGGLVRVATGNAINKHKDGSQVYFDTVAIKLGENQTAFARLTNAATGELATELGFTSARVPRPEQAASENEPSEESQQAARPRFSI